MRNNGPMVPRTIPDEWTWPLDWAGREFSRKVSVLADRSEELASAESVAVMAHYDPSGGVSRSLASYVEELRAGGFAVVVVSTNLREDTLGPLGEAHVLVRENLGYDFGSWSAALGALPELGEREVLLTNSSLIGPFGPLGPLLAHARGTGADVTAATSSLQLRPHLQSFFLRFAPGVLARPDLTAFFGGIRHHWNKVAIVRRYELGLTDLLRRSGLATAALFPAGELAVGTRNPTIAGWRELLAAGFPFVKQSLLTDPRAGVAAAEVARAVRELYGTELAEWWEES